jgi:DNA-binding SARP family transcriptional activator
MAPPVEARMWLSLLGPLYVRGQDGEVVVAAAKQRAVLAALLVRANRVVSFDEFADDVWDGAPPPAARPTLRNYVKSLRRLLGPDIGERIVTREPGYLIQVDEKELDMLRVRALCARGGAAIRAMDWRQASDALAEALSLWRGTPLADVPSETLREQALPSLDRLRLQATEWRMDADLQLGRHADLVLELQALTAEHPLRERFHAQLMLALYRSGRAAEALAAFQYARLVLADQLGADPGPDLRRLHEQMLRFDVELAGVTGARTCTVRPVTRSRRPLRCPG